MRVRLFPENPVKIKGNSSTSFLPESYRIEIVQKLEAGAAENVSCADSLGERKKKRLDTLQPLGLHSSKQSPNSPMFSCQCPVLGNEMWIRKSLG